MRASPEGADPPPPFPERLLPRSRLFASLVRERRERCACPGKTLVRDRGAGESGTRSCRWFGRDATGVGPCLASSAAMGSGLRCAAPEGQGRGRKARRGARGRGVLRPGGAAAHGRPSSGMSVVTAREPPRAAPGTHRAGMRRTTRRPSRLPGAAGPERRRGRGLRIPNFAAGFADIRRRLARELRVNVPMLRQFHRYASNRVSSAESLHATNVVASVNSD
jgi:hypothetical protein